MRVNLEKLKFVEELSQDLAVALEQIELNYDLKDILSSEAWHMSRQLQELIEEKE